MQIPSGYRVESSNTLDLRDLHAAERSHQGYNQGIPPAEHPTQSSDLYMTSKFLPGPSQLLSTDNLAGSNDIHHSAETPYYPRPSSSYNHPSHPASASFGSRYGSYHPQLVSDSGTLTPSTNQAFQTQPLPETSWTSSGIAPNPTALADSTGPTEGLRYPAANHKYSQSSSYPISAFTPPLTGREGFRSFTSSAQPGEHSSLFLGAGPENLEHPALPSASFEPYARIQSSNPFPASNHLPATNSYRGSSVTAPSNLPASSVAGSVTPFPAPANTHNASALSTSHLDSNSKVDNSSQSINSANSEMNPFPEYAEDSRKRMRYMEDAIAPGGHPKDYLGDRGLAGNKRERKGPNHSISIPSGYNMSNGMTAFEHPASAASNSFPIHSGGGPMQTPYNTGNRFMQHQSPPSSSRSDQFVNAPNFHPDYLPGAGLNVPGRGNSTDSFLHEARGIADRFHREMSALLARTPSSLLNQIVRAEDESSTPLEYARRVIDEVKRVSSALNPASPGLAVNTMNSKYPAGQGPSPVNPSPLASFVNHSINPSPMLSGEAWRPGTSNGQMDSYTPSTAGPIQTPSTAGFPPQNNSVPFNNSGPIPGITTEYAEGGRWSQMPPPPPSFVATEHGPYGDTHRARASTNLQPPQDNASTISSIRTPTSTSANPILPPAPDAGTSTSPNGRSESSRQRLPNDSGDAKEDSQESERTDTKGSGSKLRSRRQPNGPWREEEAEKLKHLAEESKGKNPNVAPDEIDWDYVVAGFENTRTRHQILIKAVYLGIRATTTHQSRLVRQKQYHGKEQAIPGLTPAKLRQYLDERREEEHDMEVLGIDKEEAASRRKQLKAKRKKAELEAEIQAKAENGYVANGLNEPGNPSFSNVLHQESAQYPPHAHSQTHWHGPQ